MSALTNQLYHHVTQTVGSFVSRVLTTKTCSSELNDCLYQRGMPCTRLSRSFSVLTHPWHCAWGILPEQHASHCVCIAWQSPEGCTCRSHKLFCRNPQRLMTWDALPRPTSWNHSLQGYMIIVQRQHCYLCTHNKRDINVKPTGGEMDHTQDALLFCRCTILVFQCAALLLCTYM